MIFVPVSKVSWASIRLVQSSRLIRHRFIRSVWTFRWSSSRTHTICCECTNTSRRRSQVIALVEERDRRLTLESWSWNSNLGCKPHRNKRLGTSFVNRSNPTCRQRCWRVLWRRVRLTQVQLFIQSERLFLFFGNNHWYIQALGNSRNTFNTGKTVRWFEKNSPGFQTSLSKLMNRVHFPNRIHSRQRKWLFPHSTEATCISRRGWVYLLAKASRFRLTPAAMRRRTVNCDCNCNCSCSGERELNANATAIWNAYNKQALLLL
jgi:hypothetical protein